MLEHVTTVDAPGIELLPIQRRDTRRGAEYCLERELKVAGRARSRHDAAQLGSITIDHPAQIVQRVPSIAVQPWLRIS